MEPMDETIRSRVKGPAVGLMVVGGLGILWAIADAIANLTGFGEEMFRGMQGGEQMPDWVASVGIVYDLVAIGVYAFVVYGATRMASLRGWGLALAAAIVALVPCNCACLIGLPIGIWAIVVLAKPEVKEAFAG